MGPVGKYMVTGTGDFHGAAGLVRLSGDEYEFIDGKLGDLNAKIQPSSQGFYDIAIGDTLAQCDKEGSD